MPRKALIHRKTKETDIRMELNLDGTGRSRISTPILFLNHMLENFAKHGSFNLVVRAKGDVEVDQHHTVEDLGIVLGEAFKKALGNKRGFNRAGYFVFPMDEVLSVVAVDISGRSYLNFDTNFVKEKIGDLDTDLIKEFFLGFSRALGATTHIRMLYGENDHHKVESIFKGFSKAMKMACQKDIKNGIPSTKGVI
jgi:imidazoleglycerol-phosphate dehydratase